MSRTTLNLPALGRDLPAEDRVKALLELGEAIGDDYLFMLIRLLRDDNAKAAGRAVHFEAQVQLANRIVARIQADNPDLPDDTALSNPRGGDTARRRAADRLGYNDGDRTNFYRILRAHNRHQARAGTR